MTYNRAFLLVMSDNRIIASYMNTKSQIKIKIKIQRKRGNIVISQSMPERQWGHGNWNVMMTTSLTHRHLVSTRSTASSNAMSEFK